MSPQFETTNDRLAKVRALVTELIEWAEADAEGAAVYRSVPVFFEDEANARARAETLRVVLRLLASCET
jgi:hypothetical protein